MMICICRTDVISMQHRRHQRKTNQKSDNQDSSDHIDQTHDSSWPGSLYFWFAWERTQFLLFVLSEFGGLRKQPSSCIYNDLCLFVWIDQWRVEVSMSKQGNQFLKMR